MCGVTSLVDALVAVVAGVDALGFIFHPKSPRNIDPEQVRLIIEELPPFIDTIGVFVDKNRDEVEKLSNTAVSTTPNSMARKILNIVNGWSDLQPLVRC